MPHHLYWQARIRQIQQAQLNRGFAQRRPPTATPLKPVPSQQHHDHHHDHHHNPQQQSSSSSAQLGLNNNQPPQADPSHFIEQQQDRQREAMREVMREAGPSPLFFGLSPSQPSRTLKERFRDFLESLLS